MMTLLQNIVVLVTQGLLMMMESTFLIKITRLQKKNNILQPAWSSSSKILIPSTSGGSPREPEITVFQWDYHNQNFYTYLKWEALIGYPFQFHIFFSNTLMAHIWPPLLHLRCFGLDFTSFLKIVLATYMNDKILLVVHSYIFFIIEQKCFKSM